MDEAVLARGHFDECAEFFDRHDAAVIDLADLDFVRHAADDFLRARHAFGACRVDVHRAVVFDVELGAGLGLDALDVLATGPISSPILSGSILIVSMRGACLLSSRAARRSALAMTSRTWRHGAPWPCRSLPARMFERKARAA